jgi:Phytanoyl-CoA dioxygenase (PhyH)
MKSMRMTDATDILAVRQALETEGYAYLPDVLGIAEVEQLRRIIESILVQTDWFDLGGTITRASPVWRETYSRIQECELLHRIANSASLQVLLSEALEGDVFCHPCKTVRVVAPDSIARTTQPHQDFPYIQGTVDTITCWIPFHDVPLGNGPLRLAPRSHLDGVLPMKVVSGDGGFGVKVPPLSGWLTDEISQGDVIIFKSMLVHAALPNVTSRFRLSMDVRYQRCDAPVCLSQTKPYPDSRGRRTWEEIGAGWTPGTLARCLPQGLRTVPFIAPRDAVSWHEDLRALLPAGRSA